MESVPKVTQRHLAFCFNTLIHALKNKKSPALEYPSNLQDYKLPIFVTLMKTDDDSLRGCIGKIFLKLTLYL